jgi:hypothetical protein
MQKNVMSIFIELWDYFLGELNKTTQNCEVVNFQTKIHAFCFPDTKSGIV